MASHNRKDVGERCGGERNAGEIWLDADAELLEELGREASYRGESINEFIEKACREKSRQD